jgi:hypothetical protein
MCDSYGGDGHSHHSITLSALRKYPWDRTAVDDVYFSKRGAIRYLKTQAFDIGQMGNYRFRSERLDLSTHHDLLAAEDRIRKLPARTTITMSIPVPAWFFAMDFHQKFMPAMGALDPNPENTRLCYYFDN